MNMCDKHKQSMSNSTPINYLSGSLEAFYDIMVTNQACLKANPYIEQIKVHLPSYKISLNHMPKNEKKKED